jgi:hypothetical protein
LVVMLMDLEYFRHAVAKRHLSSGISASKSAGNRGVLVGLGVQLVRF